MDVLVQIAAVRGAVNGLMLEVLSDHLRVHVAEPDSAEKRDAAVSDVIALMRTHLR